MCAAVFLGNVTEGGVRLQIIASKPGWMLRKNAPKMQLRESEEQNLGLDLMGRGFSAKFGVGQDIPGLGDFIPPRLDFAYGVCAPLTPLTACMCPQSMPAAFS